MISFENVHMSYPTKAGRKIVLNGLNIDFDTSKNIGILGLNGAGKSTLLKLIGGIELPERGRIKRSVNISFPLGSVGSFAPSLTGRQNAALLARIYGYDVKEYVHFVEVFAEVGHYFDEPIRTYSNGMHSRLLFGMTMALKFDVYLVDEALAGGAGDARFLARCDQVFRTRLKDTRLIIVSHVSEALLTYCDAGATLHNGHLTYYHNIKDAVAHYNEIVADPSRPY